MHVVYMCVIVFVVVRKTFCACGATNDCSSSQHTHTHTHNAIQSDGIYPYQTVTKMCVCVFLLKMKCAKIIAKACWRIFQGRPTNDWRKLWTLYNSENRATTLWSLYRKIIESKCVFNALPDKKLKKNLATTTTIAAKTVYKVKKITSTPHKNIEGNE